MPSFCNPERNLMSSLHLKLSQLSLTTMSRQLDQIVTDAASKNLGFAQALETLTDLELDARNARAIERRFRHVEAARPALHRQLPFQTSQDSLGCQESDRTPARSGVSPEGHQR